MACTRWNCVFKMPTSYSARTILLRSSAALCGEGIVSERSNTVILLYPARFRCNAVDKPHAPPPMIEILLSLDIFDIVTGTSALVAVNGD